MKKTIVLGIAALLCIAFAVSAQATILSGTLTADDYFEAYISTSDSVQGNLIGWGLVDAGTDHYGWNMDFYLQPTNISLPPSSYFLHIKAYDAYGVIAGFKGAFNLDDTGFKFVNGTQDLLTNPTNWKVGTGATINPWGVNDGVVTSVVPHASWPATVTDQSWIWTNGGSDLYCTRYFSTEIIAVPGNDPPAVPEPGTILAALSILAPAGMMFRRRK